MRILTKAIAVVVAVMLAFPPSVLAQGGASKQAQKMHAKLEKIFNDGDRAKIELNDGRKVQGHLAELGADTFVLGDYGTSNTFSYSEVKKVGRIGPSRSAKVWIPVAFTGGLLGLLTLLASQDK